MVISLRINCRIENILFEGSVSRGLYARRGSSPQGLETRKSSVLQVGIVIHIDKYSYKVDKQLEIIISM